MDQNISPATATLLAELEAVIERAFADGVSTRDAFHAAARLFGGQLSFAEPAAAARMLRRDADRIDAMARTIPTERMQ